MIFKDVKQPAHVGIYLIWLASTKLQMQNMVEFERMWIFDVKNQKTWEAFSSPLFKVDKPIYLAILTTHDYMVNCILLLSFSETHLHMCSFFSSAACRREIAKQHIFVHEKLHFI